MNTEKLKNIFDQFDHQAVYRSHKELASGHINDTYLIETEEKPSFVLQRINSGVFKDVPGLIENKVKISQHIRKKLEDQREAGQDKAVLTFIPSKRGAYYFEGDDGTYWNLTHFIDQSQTYEIAESTEIAYEGGRLMGEFLALTSDFDAASLHEVIPKFHDMSFRFSQFEDALKVASEERLQRAEPYLKIIEESKEEMHVLQSLKESGAIRTRVTHNDAKISNVLFNRDRKGICVIDTDTVMPGIVHYDFGDAIRTICNTAQEDETDLKKVSFNLDFYKAYHRGFLERMGPAMSALEVSYLPLGAKTMIFIMALRFLTDYLNNDIYYKTKYSDHNLDRAKNQFRLLESLNSKQGEMV